MEYMKIFGSTRYRSEPFLLAVTDSQYLINGFKNDWFNIYHDYEICHDNRYDVYSDYHILEFEGRFLTEKIFTDFYYYYRLCYDRVFIILDVINTDLDILNFNDTEDEWLFCGFDSLEELFFNTAPADFEDTRNSGKVESLDIFDVPKLLDKFLEDYEITLDY